MSIDVPGLDDATDTGAGDDLALAAHRVTRPELQCGHPFGCEVNEIAVAQHHAVGGAVSRVVEVRDGSGQRRLVRCASCDLQQTVQPKHRMRAGPRLRRRLRFRLQFDALAGSGAADATGRDGKTRVVKKTRNGAADSGAIIGRPNQANCASAWRCGRVSGIAAANTSSAVPAMAASVMKPVP